MFICDITKACFFTHISLTVNYHLFTHSEVSYLFNGGNNNIRLELSICNGRKKIHEKKNDSGLTIPAVACLTSPKAC